MKKIVIGIFYIGFIFFGGGFLYSLFMFFAYNGAGDTFTYEKAKLISIKIDSTRMPARYLYQYDTKDKMYYDYQNISIETARKMNTDTATIVYNKVFPQLSMILNLEGKNKKKWDFTVGMYLFGGFFAFIFLIYRFANLDKWLVRYGWNNMGNIRI